MEPRPATVPPDDPLQAVERRIKPVHAIIAAAVVIFGAGGALGAIRSKVATAEDLAEVHTATEAHIAAASAGSTAQLGALQSVVQDLRAHQAKLDATLEGLDKDVDHLTRQSDAVYQQLLEIAKSTGARRVPPPK